MLCAHLQAVPFEEAGQSVSPYSAEDGDRPAETSASGSADVKEEVEVKVELEDESKVEFKLKRKPNEPTLAERRSHELTH